MRNLKLSNFFVLLLFASTGYWFGRYSCNYPVLQSSLPAQQEHVSIQSMSRQSLKVKTAKFNRDERLRTLRKCCQRSLPSLSKQEMKTLFDHLIVDKKNKILYCYMPKVASSNMKRLILALQNRTEDSNAVQYFDQRSFEFLSDFNLRDRKYITENYFKFIFVRSPLTRIVSAYRNKLHSANTQFHSTIGRYIVSKYRKTSVPRNTIQGNDVTFQEFIRYLIDKNVALQTLNEHWMPMYELCQPCYIKYDFVGSFENLVLDTNALLSKLRSSSTVTFPRKQAQYGKSIDLEEVLEFYSNITMDEYKSLRARYFNDFKCFSYKFFNQIRNKG